MLIVSVLLRKGYMEKAFMEKQGVHCELTQ